MWNLYGGTATLTNVTFFGNSALDLGDGIGNTNDVNTHLYLTNVIVASKTVGDNCVFQKAPDTSDHNLSSDATCNFGAGRDSQTMKFGPLETNGGTTLTHRLLTGNPAIDNGVFVVSILLDQRGVTRPRGAAFDVGAVEFIPCPGTPDQPVLLSPPKKPKIETQIVLLDWAFPDCVKPSALRCGKDQKRARSFSAKAKSKPQ